MKNKKTSNKSPAQLKGKLMAALAMLLVASVLMGSTTYAWLVLSIAPEVTGITTNIGANGSLEIALLNTETRQNMNNISSGKVGESLANNNTTANNSWGNLVDLNAVNYGLSNIILMPARLDAVANGGNEGYTVASGLLSVPTYGYDGRVIEVSKDAVSAIYNNSEFSFVPAAQDYGVRAIGTSDSLTVQGSALAMAKSNVATYTNSANGAAAGSLANNGSAVFDIMVSHMLDSSATFDDADMDVIMSMVSDLQSSINYIDLALRLGLVGFTASVVEIEDEFESVRDKIIDQNKSLSVLLTELDELVGTELTIPDNFSNWVAILENAQNDLNGAYNSCSELTTRGAPYTWDEILGALSKLMNLEGVYINETKYSEFDKSQAGSLIGGDIVLTLAPGSGVFATVADFADDFSTIVSTMGTSVEIATSTTEDPVHLVALLASMSDLEAAGGSSGTQPVTLSATYGYALDLAFRCNASESELLLQTSGIQRVYNDSIAATTQGGGSFMEFAVTDDIAQSILLMDAVRVAFIDDSGNLLAVAKLNTSNRQTTESVIKAPLYLYDFEISEEDGMIMGERRMTDNTITTLQKNIARAVTVVVWLDGDVVDNTMVSATEETSLSGMLNLQFASSADLIPAENSEYMAIVANRDGLWDLVDSWSDTYENGQGTYTTIGWNAFAAAYANAVAVCDDETATDSQIKSATYNLQTASRGLTVVSKAALNSKVAEIREMMGETADLARIVILDKNSNYVALGEYTQEQYDVRIADADIKRVDYTNNLRDEGNGIQTAIYSDESWSALASALYAAEAVIADENATDEQIDGALTTLETAYDALEHGAYFLPYDFNGSLYYYAVPKDANDDTYGKWYDSDFKRIVADKTILDLDAHAEEIDIAKIYYTDYLPWDYMGASGVVDLLVKTYPKLQDEVIAGLTWSSFDASMFVEPIQPYHIAALNNIVNVNTDNQLGVDVSAAEELLKVGSHLASEAEAVINDLGPKVNAALEEKLAKDAADAEAANPYMTADQHTLLITALNAVQSIVDAYHPGYDEEGNLNPEDPGITSMKEDIASVTAMLAGNVTKEEADANLDELNAHLTANGKTAVTFANTIVHSIPLGSEVTDIVYNVEYPNLLLDITGKTGTAVLGAIGVTKNGVIIDITHKVTVYTPADDVVFKTGTTESLVDLPATIAVGETLNVFALLDYSVTRDAEEIELGNVTIVNGKAEVAVPEHIESGIWHSSNMSIATVTGSGTGSVTGIVPGVVTIDVSIETVEGNTYTESFTITVTP